MSRTFLRRPCAVVSGSFSPHLPKFLRPLKPTGATVLSALAFAVTLTIALPGTSHAENRTYDGTDNNLANTNSGAAGSDLIRIAPAAYGNGYSTPSGAVSTRSTNHQQHGECPNGFDSQQHGLERLGVPVGTVHRPRHGPGELEHQSGRRIRHPNSQGRSDLRFRQHGHTSDAVPTLAIRSYNRHRTGQSSAASEFNHVVLRRLDGLWFGRHARNGFANGSWRTIENQRRRFAAAKHNGTRQRRQRRSSPRSVLCGRRRPVERADWPHSSSHLVHAGT